MGDININGDHNSVVVGRRGGIGFFGSLFLLFAVILFWKWIVAVLVIAALASTVYLVVKGFQSVEDPVKALAARADAQHQAILEGDIETGTYGQFPPAV